MDAHEKKPLPHLRQAKRSRIEQAHADRVAQAGQGVQDDVERPAPIVVRQAGDVFKNGDAGGQDANQLDQVEEQRALVWIAESGPTTSEAETLAWEAATDDVHLAIRAGVHGPDVGMHGVVAGMVRLVGRSGLGIQLDGAGARGAKRRQSLVEAADACEDIQKAHARQRPGGGRRIRLGRQELLGPSAQSSDGLLSRLGKLVALDGGLQGFEQPGGRASHSFGARGEALAGCGQWQGASLVGARADGEAEFGDPMPAMLGELEAGLGSVLVERQLAELVHDVFGGRRDGGFAADASPLASTSHRLLHVRLQHQRGNEALPT